MCIELPKPELPTLGGGLSIEPPSLGSFSGEADLCCKRLAFSVPLPPVPLLVPVNGAIMVAIADAMKLIQNYVDSLPVDCPLE